ncbi:MAG: porin family protein [Rhodobacteraceae bacterium]|nr:porin family protein [Paracoccaceae bacterium]
MKLDMLKQLAAGAVLGAMCTTAANAGSNSPVMPEQPVTFTQPSVGYDWTGPYVGGVGAYGMLNSETSDHWCWVACDGASMASGGGGVGLALGYDWQMGSLVVGGVVDHMVTNFENINIHDGPTNNKYTSYTEASWNSLTTLRARAGLAADQTLFYATGGLAWADVNYRHDYNHGPDAEERGFLPYSGREMGFAAGGGIEHAVSNNISISAEYLYVGLRSVAGGAYYRDWDDIPGSQRDGTVSYRSSAHKVRLGVNFRF